MHLTNFKAEDTVAPFEFFRKNGYYTVGGKIFNHKILALQYATVNRLPVQWEFNTKEFDQLDWSQRLGLDIRTLYRQRAQQLRDRYNYLIVGWSGGGDSSTVLYSFLNNGIHLDEVVVMWPITQTKGRYQPSRDTICSNILSEWDLAIQPQIEELKSRHPNLKITVLDYMQDLSTNEDKDDTILILEKNNYGSLQKYRAADDLLEQRTKKYHDVAWIMGASPVCIDLYDEWLMVKFNDLLANPGPKSDYTATGLRRNVELFYWSPDLPELVREQAHMMLDYYILHPEAIPLTLDWLRLDRSNIGFYQAHQKQSEELRRQIIKSVVYPDYPQDIFQAVKPKDYVYQTEMFEWFWSNPHSQEYIDSWDSCMRSHHSVIDPKYTITSNGRVIRYRAFESKIYAVGKLPVESMIKAFPSYA